MTGWTGPLRLRPGRPGLGWSVRHARFGSVTRDRADFSAKLSCSAWAGAAVGILSWNAVSMTVLVNSRGGRQARPMTSAALCTLAAASPSRVCGAFVEGPAAGAGGVPPGRVCPSGLSLSRGGSSIRWTSRSTECRLWTAVMRKVLLSGPPRSCRAAGWLYRYRAGRICVTQWPGAARDRSCPAAGHAGSAAPGCAGGRVQLPPGRGGSCVRGSSTAPGGVRVTVFVVVGVRGLWWGG
jgi:hypothetical protein